MSDRKPHLCPACKGYTQISNPALVSGIVTTAVPSQFITCPTCKGAGVLWDPSTELRAGPDLEARVAALEKVAHPQGVLTDPELTEALKRYNEDRKMTGPKFPPFPPILDRRDDYDFRPRVICGLAFPGIQLC